MSYEVVHIALDVMPATRAGVDGHRVLVRGVFTDPNDAPPPYDGASRNPVGAFLNMPVNGEPGAFWIPKDEAK